jgi:5-deoxy-glucuronate isomerase
LTAIASAAPPNDLTADRLRVRPGADGVSLAVDPARAGWRHLSFEAALLRRGEELRVGDADRETVIVTIRGGLDATTEGTRFDMPGRASVWDGLPWALYLPAGSWATVRATDDRSVVARAMAPISDGGGASHEPVLVHPQDVAVEVRGAGNATRQINHIVTPDFPAHRLLVVEVYTPSGNWSSWPPHKHDVDDMPREAVLEEIYYYQFRRPEAWGIQRLYRRDGSRDALWAVHDGELVLVTDGYHPFVAAHGDDAYYLNALAGDRRTMACSFDPDLDRVRAEWAGMAADPRVPLVAPAGRGSSR